MAPSFVPIRLVTAEAPSPPVEAAPMPAAGEAAGSMVEIALPNGCRLRVPAGIDGTALRRLMPVALPPGTKVYLALAPVDR